METILNNSGFQHLAEKIFLPLNYEDLTACCQINRSSKIILVNPMFWLKKFITRGLPKKNQKDWTESIQSLKNTYLETIIHLYLKKCSKNKHAFDIPCYINEDTIFDIRKEVLNLAKNFETSTKKLWRQWKYHEMDFIKSLALLKDENGNTSVLVATMNGNAEMVQILSPLLDNLNASNHNGLTPLDAAILYGYSDIVKILAPLTHNMDEPDQKRHSPILKATAEGNAEIVQILVPFAENPNAPHQNGITPIEVAIKQGKTEIVKILAPFLNNLDIPDEDGMTLVMYATLNGRTEIVRILASLTDNPNAPNNKNTYNGLTPLEVAAHEGHTDIVKILAPFSK